MQLAQPDLTQARVRQSVHSAPQAVFLMWVNLHVLSVQRGPSLPRLVPQQYKHALAVYLASSVQRDQLFALTAGLDTIRTVLWIALLALQEQPPLLFAAQASMSAQHVSQENTPLRLGHPYVLHAMLGGMLYHLEQTPVLRAQLVGIQA